MIRLECGPRDAAKQQCVLAVSKTAGQVAVKQTFDVSMHASASSLANVWLLYAMGRANLERLPKHMPSAPDHPQGTLYQSSLKTLMQIGPRLLAAVGNALGRALADDVLQTPPYEGDHDVRPGKEAAQPLQQASSAVALGSGDDLVGDFEDDKKPEEAAWKSRKKRKKKAGD